MYQHTTVVTIQTEIDTGKKFQIRYNYIDSMSLALLLSVQAIETTIGLLDMHLVSYINFRSTILWKRRCCCRKKPTHFKKLVF